VTVGGMICFFAFIFWTIMAFLAFLAAGNFYTFFRSMWFGVFAIGYISIMVVFTIGKRIGKKYG